jgi:hypothetical protein
MQGRALLQLLYTAPMLLYLYTRVLILLCMCPQRMTHLKLLARAIRNGPFEERDGVLRSSKAFRLHTLVA